MLCVSWMEMKLLRHHPNGAIPISLSLIQITVHPGPETCDWYYRSMVWLVQDTRLERFCRKKSSILMLRQTPCEKSTVEWGRCNSTWILVPTDVCSPGWFLQREIRQRQRGKKNELKRSNLTQVYWIHAWSRPPSKSGADVWPLDLISQTREKKKVAEPSWPQLLISWRIYECCCQESLLTERKKYGAILVVLWPECGWRILTMWTLASFWQLG